MATALELKLGRTYTEQQLGEYGLDRKTYIPQKDFTGTLDEFAAHVRHEGMSTDAKRKAVFHNSDDVNNVYVFEEFSVDGRKAEYRMITKIRLHPIFVETTE